MTNDESPLLQPDERQRIEPDAATDILQMLTSDRPEPSVYEPAEGQVTQRSLRQDTTMWF